MDDPNSVSGPDIGSTSPAIPIRAATRGSADKAIAVGKFPKLTTTLRAEALATLLAGEDMSGVASVFASGSTKLATVMRALTRRYRWPIERTEFATNLPDGRVAWISMYTLPAGTVASALDLGADAWIAEVRAARLKRPMRATSAISNLATATEMKCTTTEN